MNKIILNSSTLTHFNKQAALYQDIVCWASAATLSGMNTAVG